MKIAVHGTQNGAKTFTSEFLSGVTDPNSDNPSDDSVGQKGFAISFTKNECVFSKYGIIQDVQGNKRVGYIGFSLGIPNESKMAGSYIKEILDQLAKGFYDGHIKDSYNLDTFQKDWTFIEKIKREHRNDITDKNDIENFPQGEKDAAFIYYSSQEELQKYFDVPYQEDYKPYKRVFFIDEKYKDEVENPLHALRHSKDANLTDRKILENLPYKVFIPHNNNDISIKVSSDGKDIHNNDEVYPNDSIKITFSKRNHHGIPIDGTVAELKEKHPEYVNVDDSNRKLTIIPPKKLIAEKTIDFNVSPSNFTLSVKNKREDIKVIANGRKIKFSNQAIEKACIVTISAKGYKDKTIDFYPKETDTIQEGLEEKGKSAFFKNPRILGGTAVILIVLSLGFILKDSIFGSTNPGTENGVKSQYEIIMTYSEGTELRLDSITKYIKIADSNDNTDSTNKKEKEGWFRWFGWFKSIFGSSKDTAVTSNESWELLSKKLDTIKLIRQAINNGSIDSLKNLSTTFQYSDNQKSFKIAVLKIDSLYIENIRNSMKGGKNKVSMMKINQIADFINNYQQILKIEIKGNENIDSLKKKQKRIKNKLKLEPTSYLYTANMVRDSILNDIKKQINTDNSDRDKEVNQKKKEKPKKLEKPNSQKGVKSGAEKRTPKKTKNGPDERYEKKFEQEFWSLIKRANKDKSQYDALIDNYNKISSKNKFKKFYVKYLSKSVDFDKFKKTPKMKLDKAKRTRDLEELEEYLNKQ